MENIATHHVRETFKVLLDEHKKPSQQTTEPQLTYQK